MAAFAVRFAVKSRDALHWFPGHMAKAVRRLTEDMRFVDAVIEVIDARIPQNRCQPGAGQAYGVQAPRGRAHPRRPGRHHAHQTLDRALLQRVRCGHRDRRQEPGRHPSAQGLIAALPGKRATTRAVIAGVPNAGKSTVINALAGRKAARVEDRAGVTRAQQWIRVGAGFELLDTAGILPTRVERPEESWKLAVTNAVPRSLFEPEEIAREFHAWSVQHRGERSAPSLETFATQRGLLRGGTIDEHNAAWSYLKEVGDGAFGRFTLDEPPE